MSEDINVAPAIKSSIQTMKPQTTIIFVLLDMELVIPCSSFFGSYGIMELSVTFQGILLWSYYLWIYLQS